MLRLLLALLTSATTFIHIANAPDSHTHGAPKRPQDEIERAVRHVILSKPLRVTSALAVAAVCPAIWIYTERGKVFSPTLEPHDLIGALIFFCGFALRVWSMRTLGSMFTYSIGIRQGHSLVTSGPYKLLMHPAYTGGVLLGIGLLIQLFGLSPNLFWVLLIPPFVFLVKRIATEEAMLSEHFGAEFERYRASRFRLIPYVW